MGMSGAEDAAEYIRNIARQVADDTFAEFKKYLVAEVIPKLPTHEAVVREVVATMNAKADQALQELGARMGQIENAIQRTTASATPSVDSGQQSSRGLTTRGLTTQLHLGGNTLDIGSLIDLGIDKITKLLELRALSNNPFIMRAKLALTNPAMLPMYAYAFAPPTQEQILLAQRMLAEGMSTGLKTRVEVLKGVQQWHTTPSSDSPNSNPAWYGGPSAPQTGPQNAPQSPSGAPNPGAATMSGSRSKPAPSENGQDTVRAPRLLNTKGPPRLQGNFR